MNILETTKHVANAFGIDCQLVMSRCRWAGGFHRRQQRPNVVAARFTTYLIVRRELGSANKAGMALGVGHDTVLNGIRRLADWCETDQDVRRRVESAIGETAKEEMWSR